uniref:CUB domain-containing protein n=1 Tax=Biomphalaria glabrata TaxID=6526 RepID=A0A2C9L008_BIOGL
MKMARTLLNVCLVAATIFNAAIEATKTKYLSSECGDEVKVNGDVLIKLNSWFQPNCKVTLVPRSGDRLIARFTYYHFNGFRNIIGLIANECTFESIQLSTSDSHYYFDEDDGFCGAYKPSGLYDLGQKGYFSYNSKNGLTSSMKADLLVTEVFDKRNNTCASGQFDCDKNNYCISDDVTCNGYDNCGNDRDEVKGCGLTTPIIIGIVVGCICFVVLIIVIGVCIAKHR